jgi:hypothetical protein
MAPYRTPADLDRALLKPARNKATPGRISHPGPNLGKARAETTAPARTRRPPITGERVLNPVL